jgi:hypothetical protein
VATFVHARYFAARGTGSGPGRRAGVGSAGTIPPTIEGLASRLELITEGNGSCPSYPFAPGTAFVYPRTECSGKAKHTTPESQFSLGNVDGHVIDITRKLGILHVVEHPVGYLGRVVLAHVGGLVR